MMIFHRRIQLLKTILLLRGIPLLKRIPLFRRLMVSRRTPKGLDGVQQMGQAQLDYSKRSTLHQAGVQW